MSAMVGTGTRVGVGFSERADSREAGAEAARAALRQAGADQSHLAILFSTSRHDPQALMEGVREIIGPISRLIGGYGVGVITNDESGYDGYQVGVAVLVSEALEFELFVEGNLAEREFDAGAALGSQIHDFPFSTTPNLLLLYDSVNRLSGRLKLNMATPLLEGMATALGPLDRWPRTAGLGMVGDMQCKPTYQWLDDQVLQQSAMGIGFAGGVRMDTLIMHGCKPTSGYHTITKTDGPVVLEIDDRPALEVISELLGPDSKKTWRDYSFFVTLGVNKGDKFDDFREENYANRLCLGVDQGRGGLVMFEPDLKPSSEFQLMRRSVDFEYVGRRCEEMLASLEGRTPLLAFYIDCAGRAAAYAGIDEEEAWEVMRVIGARMPLLGVYSGVEIAAVGSHLQALDWTGVLCVLSE